MAYTIIVNPSRSEIENFFTESDPEPLLPARVTRRMLQQTYPMNPEQGDTIKIRKPRKINV